MTTGGKEEMAEKSEEQRKRWNDYNNGYAKKNYKSYNLKMNKEHDQDIIDYFEKSGESPTTVVRKLVRNQIEREAK